MPHVLSVHLEQTQDNVDDDQSKTANDAVYIEEGAMFTPR